MRGLLARAGSSIGAPGVQTALFVSSATVGLGAQWFYTDRHTEWLGRVGYGGAAILALAFAWLSRADDISTPVRSSEGDLGYRIGTPILSALAVGTAFSVAACILVSSGHLTLAAAVAATSVAVVLVGAWIDDSRGCTPRRILSGMRGHDWRSAIVCVALVLLAAWYRVDSLEALPADVHNDEGAHGLQALAIINGMWPPGEAFGFGWSNLPTLSFLPHVVTMLVAGDGLWGLRLASAIQGVLCVGLMAQVGRALFGWQVGLVAAGFLAASHWHIHFSRIGISNMGALAVSLATLLAAVRLGERAAPGRAVVLGTMFAACSLVYFAARLTPLIAAGFLLACWYASRTAPSIVLRSSLLIALATGITIAPFAFAASMTPDALTSRLGAVSVFSPRFMDHAREVHQVDSLTEMLRLHALWSIEGLVASRDTSIHYNTAAPLLDQVSAPFALIGLMVVAIQMRNPRAFMVCIWLGLTLLLGAILTDSAPFSPRILGLLPALALCIGLAVVAGWRSLQVHGAGFARLAIVLIGLWGIALAMSNRRAYLDTFAAHQQLTVTTAVARLIEQLDLSKRVVVLHAGTPILSQETPRFIAPRPDGIELGPENHSRIGSIPTGSGGIAFIVLAEVPKADEAMAQIRQRFPQGREQTVTTGRRTRLFRSYIVDGTST